MSSERLGGWSPWSFALSEEAKKVFEKALTGLLGVDYTPLSVATQIVSGKNYCFLCKGVIVVPESPEIVAKIYIYQPFEGDPHITDITRVNP